MKTVTYVGPAGSRRLGPDDGFTVDLEFTRGVPTKVADENFAHLMGGPHAREFVEGEPAEPVETPHAGVAAGAITDPDGDQAPASAAAKEA